MEVLYRQEQAIAYVTINRPEALNALNRKVLERLEEIFFDLERSPINTVVLTGMGRKAFVAGADLAEVQAAGEARADLVENGKRILVKIGSSEKVVIAAINGYALGGGSELALFCDIRIASETAKFGFPEAKLGLIPGYGGTQLLPRLIGPGRAKYLMFTGETISAATAHQLGLVDRVYAAADLAFEAEKLAKTISANGPVALRCIKTAINNGMGLPLQEALQVESEQYQKVAESEDAEVGMAAFMGRKAAAFKGE
jgi:enoyl-CoA hydratase